MHIAINKFLKQSASKKLTFPEEIVTQTKGLEKIFCALTLFLWPQTQTGDIISQLWLRKLKCRKVKKFVLGHMIQRWLGWSQLSTWWNLESPRKLTSGVSVRELLERFSWGRKTHSELVTSSHGQGSWDRYREVNGPPVHLSPPWLDAMWPSASCRCHHAFPLVKPFFLRWLFQ